jgi:hypothetical protein
MTPERYVGAVHELARRREYGPLIELAERYGPEVEDQLSAEQVRVLRVHLKHADMVTSRAQARTGSA